MSLRPSRDGCDLCEAARITPWFHEDDLCWIAECEICATPMVVLRWHERAPDEAVKTALHARLADVVAEHFSFEHYVDDNMRNIPDHYHAHARPKGGFFGHGLRRTTHATTPPPAPEGQGPRFGPSGVVASSPGREDQ